MRIKKNGKQTDPQGETGELQFLIGTKHNGKQTGQQGKTGGLQSLMGIKKKWKGKLENYNACNGSKNWEANR